MKDIEVGVQEERYLIDYMADGSTVAKLIFDLDIVRILKKRNALWISVLRAQEDADYHAQQVQARVMKYAIKFLGE